MKSQFKTFLLAFAAFMMVASLANAQLIATNNFGNYDPSGPFSLNGKFASMGESGGVPGPTANGCDLYGFRAQVDSSNSVNLGMQAFASFDFPTLSFEGLPFLITQEGATGSGGGGNFGCGKILGVYFDGLGGGGAVTNVVYSILGSGVATGGVWIPSDLKLKKNVEPLSDAMSILKELNGVSYEYKTDERPELNLNEGRQIGFIAQDVKEVLPEAVQATFDQEGKIADYVVMNYDAIIPILTEAVKDQQRTIETLETRIAKLESMMTGNGASERNSFAPSSDAKVSLSQNRPNPFQGITVIEYNTPTTMNNAQLVIYDAKGSAIESIALAPGKGTVNYNAGRLNSGIYFYSIELNGQSLARQKMVLK